MTLPPIYVQFLEGDILRAQFILQERVAYTLTDEEKASITDWSKIRLRFRGAGWKFQTEGHILRCKHVSGVIREVVGVTMTYPEPS